MTQQQLADALDVHWMTISKLERGRMQLTTGWLDRIGGVLKVPFQDLVNPERPTQEILVRGKIINGLTIQEPPNGPYYEEVGRYGDDLVSEWLLVEGRDLEPFFFNGDAVKVTYYWAEDFKFLVGRLACVSFDKDDGGDTRVFAVVDKYLGEDNRFDLRSLKGIRFENVRVNDIGIIAGLMINAPDYPDTDS